MSHIFHILSQRDWETANKQGSYQPASLASEGFIHFSQAHQLTAVANAFYKGQDKLLVLVVDKNLLASTLKMEAPAHPTGQEPENLSADDLFPHLYGALNLNAVAKVVPFTPNQAGIFSLPPALKG